jgi:hypothetical protein
MEYKELLLLALFNKEANSVVKMACQNFYITARLQDTYHNLQTFDNQVL